MTAPDRPWRFIQLDRFVRRLRDSEPEGGANEVLTALGRILADPYDPPDLVSYPMRGRRDLEDQGPKGERRIAELPHDWFITYLAVEWEEMPPFRFDHHVIVLALSKRPDLGRFSP